jgi:MYXO-CTERM domain-containing protein
MLLLSALAGPGDDLDGDGVVNPVDCVDTDPTIFPGAPEVVADGIDQDCDQVDACYFDFDEDGYGTAQVVLDSDTNCRNDSGLTADNALDCDDDDPEKSPDAVEIPGNDLDEDCDGLDDCWVDLDGDGFGVERTTVALGSCGEPGTAIEGNDCDDEDRDSFPGAEEVCDGVDNDCDGDIDTDADAVGVFFGDFDEDGFGDPLDRVEACEAPDGYVADASDCNDGDPTAFPGADERCDAVDNDCNGIADDEAVDAVQWRPDEDGDGFGSADEVVSDCFEPLDGRFWVIDDGTTALDCNDFDPFIGRCLCGCATEGSAGAGWWALVGLGLLVRWRRVDRG